MLTQSDLLFGVGLPALLGLVLFAVFRGRQAQAVTSDIGRDASPYALAIGFLTVQVAILGPPTIPPLDVVEWLSFGLVALLVLTAIAQFGPATVGRFYQPLAMALILLPTIWLLARPLIENAWSHDETIRWVAGSALVAVAMTLSLAGLLRRQSNAITSAGLVIAIGGTAIVLLLSGTKTYAQLAAAGAAALAPGIVLAALGRGNPFSWQLAPTFALTLGGLVLAGHWYASLTPRNALLLALAPLGLWIGQIPLLVRWRAWQRGLAELVAVAVPVLVAFALALQKFLADTADGY